MKTPYTENGLKKFDSLPSEEAIIRAWTDPGNDPSYHREMQWLIRSMMPVLGRALDRASARRHS